MDEHVTNSPTLGQQMKAIHSKPHIKAFGMIFLVMFIVSLAIIFYDHFKYGKEDPPKALKAAVNASVGIMLCLIFIVMVWIIWVTKKLEVRDPKLTSAVMIFAFVMVLSGIWWAYYHYKVRPEYDNDPSKMPKYHQVLHKIAMWTAITCIVILLIMVCSQDPLVCFLLSE